MQNLRLPLKKKWFEMTKAGIKTEDYREITPYWIKRLTSNFSFDINKYLLKLNENKDVINKGSMEAKSFTKNTMTLGCQKKIDTEKTISFKHKGIEIRTGNPDWSAEPDKLYFVILHGERC